MKMTFRMLALGAAGWLALPSVALAEQGTMRSAPQSGLEQNGETGRWRTTASPELQRHFERMSEEFTVAWNRGDATTMARFFTADASFMNPAGDRAEGQEAIRQLMQRQHEGTLRGSSVRFTLEKAEIIRPNLALVEYHQQILGVRTGEAATRDVQAHAVVLMERRGNVWQIRAVRALPSPRPMDQLEGIPEQELLVPTE